MIRDFNDGLAAKSIRLDVDPGDASWKTRVPGETLDTIKQAATRVSRRNPDSVKKSLMSTAHNDLHRNRGFTPWQLLLGKTPSDKSVCEILILLSAVSNLWTRLQGSVLE